jgi:hypothetical protein
VARDCLNKSTLLIHDNGVYSSASDSEELEHTLLATNNAAKTDIHVNSGDADRYESLVAQHVLSTQVAPSREESVTHSVPYEWCCAGAFDSHHHRQRQLQQFGKYYACREVVFTHS